MKSKYKVYPSYKDSGVEWLRDVPESWKVENLKYAIDMIQTGTTPSTTELEYYNGNVNWFNPTDLNSQILTNSTKHVTRKAIVEGACRMFPGDSVLIVGIGATAGKTSYLAEKDSSFNQQITGFHSKSNYNKYLFYLMKSFTGTLLATANFTTLAILNNDFFKSFVVVTPSLQEQQTIANYLDKATTKIDTLIEKQTKLIELLKEKRQAVISTAVTRGLDSSVPMKDSGVEWLGEIPEGWSLKNVKYLLNNHIGIKIGPFGSSLKLDDMTNTGYKVYGQENVINRNFSIGHRFISEAKFKSMIVYKVEPDDILITMMGTIGKCIVVPKEHDKGIIDSHLIKIRTNELMLPSYFVMMIDKSNVVKTQLELNSKGSIMQGLNSSIIKSLLFPLPNITEQQQILDYLDEKTTKIDNLITKATKAIDLLKERRTALISAVVTGKIDVRSAG